MPELFDTTEFKRSPEQIAFPEGCFKGLPRPDGYHEGVKRLVLDTILPDVLAWFGEEQEQEQDQDEVREQLLDVLEYGVDGYQMAKNLERRHGWDVDSELVDVLDGFDFYNPTKAAVKAWIRDNGITPKFQVGQSVNVKTSKWDKVIHAGEIVRVDDAGNYIVMIPSLGHVREGLGTHGSVLAWQDVEAINSAE